MPLPPPPLLLLLLLLTYCFSSVAAAVSRKAKAIEFMVVDALLEADQVLQLTDKIHKPEDFVHLNDSILEMVRGALPIMAGVCAEIKWLHHQRLEPQQEFVHLNGSIAQIVHAARQSQGLAFCAAALLVCPGGTAPVPWWYRACALVVPRLVCSGGTAPKSMWQFAHAILLVCGRSKDGSTRGPSFQFVCCLGFRLPQAVLC